MYEYILRTGSASSWTLSSVNSYTDVLIDTGALLVDIFETSGTRGPANISGKEEGLRIEFQEVLFAENSISECSNLVVYWSVRLKPYYVYLTSILSLFIRTQAAAHL